MNKNLQMVKDFHREFGHPIAEKPTIPSLEEQKLRLELLAEECGELVDALANKDKVEVLDALADIQYILNGTILSFGFKNVFDNAFKEVHRSNMSKMCKTLKEAEETQKKYFKEVIVTKIDPTETGFRILRASDEKVLKSINYSKAELAQFVKDE